MPTPLPNPILFDDKQLKDDPEAFCNTLNQFAASTRDNVDTSNNTVQFDTYTVFISDSASPYPISFRWRNSATLPKSCIIGYIDTTDGEEGVLSGIAPRWKYSEGRIVVFGLRGTLVQDKTYTITFETKADRTT